MERGGMAGSEADDGVSWPMLLWKVKKEVLPSRTAEAGNWHKWHGIWSGQNEANTWARIRQAVWTDPGRPHKTSVNEQPSY